MSNIRDALRRMINNEKLGTWTEPEKPVQPPAAPPKVHSTPTPPSYTMQSPTLQPVREALELDPNCDHKWQWNDGVKSCWLCGGPAPLDRRGVPSSTSSEGKTYRVGMQVRHAQFGVGTISQVEQVSDDYRLVVKFTIGKKTLRASFARLEILKQ